MKKPVNFVSTILIALLVSLGMTSCTEHYVTITAQTSCSPDLLQFVTPTVTITGDNGESSSFELSASDFQETEEGGTIIISINGVSIESTAVNNVAQCAKKFSHVESIKGNIHVTYKLKSEYSLDKDEYVFFHGLGYKYKTEMIELAGSPFKPIANEVSKDDVKEYLDRLVIKGDDCDFSIEK